MMEWDQYDRALQTRTDNCQRILSYAIVGIVPSMIFASSILVNLNVADFDSILLPNTFRPHEFVGEAGFNVAEQPVQGGALFNGIVAVRNIVGPAFLYWFIFTAIAWRKFPVVGRTMAWSWMALVLLVPNANALQIQRTYISDLDSAKQIMKEAREPSESERDERKLAELNTKAQIAWVEGDKAEAKTMLQATDWHMQWKLQPEMQDRVKIMLGEAERRAPLCYLDTLCLPLWLAKVQQIVALSILIANIIILFFTLWLSRDLQNRRAKLLDRYSVNTRSIRSEHRQNSMIGAT